MEAELRTREAEVRQLRTDLQRAEMFNAALQGEVLAHRGVLVGVPTSGPGAAPAAPVAAMSNMVKEVVFGRGTGGLDQDGQPGDEALLVVLVPKDVDGSAIKAPGSLVVQAAEVTPQGNKIPLSQWDVSALQLQKEWKSGLLATGYYVTLPWKQLPSTERLRIAVQFTTLPDGRLFETDKDIFVKLVPGMPPRRVMPPAPTTSNPGPGPIVPVDPRPKGEVLPPPIDGPNLNSGAAAPRPVGPIQPVRLEAAKPAPPGPRDPQLLEPRLPD